MNERFFLIDCGEGTQMQLRRYKLSPARINHIFISHLHGDHVFGLFGLLSSLGLMGRKAPLSLYGPHALQEMMETHLGFFGPLPFRVQYPECRDREVVYEDSKNRVMAVSLNHRTETFGYLFREKPRLLNVDKSKIEQYGLGVEDIKFIKQGKDHQLSDGTLIPNRELTLPPYRQRSYAYISDTTYLKDLAPVIGDVDLLFHEATFLEKDAGLAGQTFHSTAHQAASFAKEAGAGKLLIGHLSTRYKDEGMFLDEARKIFPETVLVNDGDRFSVGLSRSEI